MPYIGIDLGGTNIAAGLINDKGEILLKSSVPTRADRPYQEIIKDMAKLSLQLIKEEGVELADISGIGIGSPGNPDCKAGTIVFSGNLNFHNTPIRDELKKYIDLPIFIENDANCAALAEATAGAAAGVKDSITITLGTGVGGGIIIDGRIYSGFNYAAAEPGHMVISMDGEACTCGRKGCWEAYASATALIRQTIKAAKENPSSIINQLVGGDLSMINAKTAFDAKRAGDETGIYVVDTYTRYIAEGLINVINILEPEVVAIGGGVSKEGEYLLAPLREIVYSRVFSRGGVPLTRIVAAKMGNDAGIVGAAMLVKAEGRI